ncbi:MAG TPA: hypothetical protein VGO11_16870 [Chthoniobacteraceae bacterium]|nr:hypothetical protein [Chthoniobacteraceae bacterium]
MSTFEQLLQLYAEPEKVAKLEAFNGAVYRASQDGAFNDQLPADGIATWVKSVWQDRHC